MKNDIRDWNETENDRERTVTYKTQKAHVIVHIPKRSEAEQAAYEKNVKAALRRFYHSVTEKGSDWKQIVAKSNLCS